MDTPATGLASYPRGADAFQTGMSHRERLLRQLPAVIWTTDGELRLTAIHGASLGGFSSAELTGMRLVDLFGVEHEADGTISAHHHALRGESARYDLVWREQTWQVQVEPLRAADGSTIGTVGLALDITARSMAEQALKQREAHLRLALAAAGAATWEWTLETDEIVRSEGMAALYGLPPGALDGVFKAHFACLHPDDRGKVVEMDRTHVAEGAPYDVEYRVIWPDGSTHWLREKAQSVRDVDGRVVRLLGVTMEVTDRKEAEAALRQSEARLAALVRNAPDLITVLDADGIIRYKSPATEQVLGYGPDELIGENALALIHPDDLPRVGALFAECLAKPGVNIPADFRFPHQDGSWRWLEAVGTNLLGDPNVSGIVVNSRDVTDRRRAEEQLVHLAYHDPLTGLPNRAFFMERLDEALGRARRGAAPVAVLFLDLDGFKLINDSRGHHAGDALLTQVGQRLRGCLPPEVTLARLGGDEFAVLLEGITDTDAAARVAERLIGTLRRPILLEGGQAYINASVGIAVSTRRRHSAVDLLRSADIALYRAKATGWGSVAIFEPWMQAPVTERLERETALRRALDRDELELHYQPKVELATGRIVGAEALVRWARPEQGVLPAADFIPAAEETGLIVLLGRWALREACRQARRWQECHPEAPPLICVNLSARQLREAGLVHDVAQALEESGLEAHLLVLEITETTAMSNLPDAQQALRALRTLGVRLAIDDFGTGYSSLGSLRDLAVDALKIDGSFVAGLGKDRASLAIVRAVTVLAHDLGVEVVAEGVETADQVTRLRELNVELGQGFYFAPPLSSEAFADLLARGVELPENPNRADDTGHRSRWRDSRP